MQDLAGSTGARGEHRQSLSVFTEDSVRELINLCGRDRTRRNIGYNLESGGDADRNIECRAASDEQDLLDIFTNLLDGFGLLENGRNEFSPGEARAGYFILTKSSWFIGCHRIYPVPAQKHIVFQKEMAAYDN